MSDFFAVRKEIATKLLEITEFKKIYTPLNSVQVTEMSQVTPSAHVNFVGIVARDNAGRGNANFIHQKWSVTVACRNAQAQMVDGSSATDEAGNLLDKVILKLSGWQPDSSSDALRLDSVDEGYSPTFVYLTAVFISTRLIIGGNDD